MVTETKSAIDAKALHHESLVVDGLSVMALTPKNIDEALGAGLDAIHFTSVRPRHDLAPALKDIAAAREAIDANSNKLMLARTADDVREAKTSGRLGIILGLQDPKPIRDDIAYLRTLADLGVRVVQLTHNTQNYIGTGCLEPDHGLTRFGRKVVAEMNRLGIIVDIAHCGPKTSLDAIECSERPVLCSHSNPRAIVASPRNKPDEVFERLAAKGGVAGIACWSPMTYRGNGKRPGLADMLDCFDHVLRLIGPDHVAIGTDMCEGLYTSKEEWQANHGPSGNYPEVTGQLGSWYGFETWYAEGIDHMVHIPNITSGLLERGHSVDATRKVLGENILRVLANA
jgi:membrane dipeptidase